MKSKIKRIVIIGLGLIGGSLARDLKASGYYVIGISRKKETINTAKKEGVINEGYISLEGKILNSVELIIITTPLNKITDFITQISKIVKSDVILTDAGSTKSDICNFAKKVLPPNIIFIGGHPMAGTEESGFSTSKRHLFKKCAWILTPLDKSKHTKNAIAKLLKIVKSTGAIPIITSAKKHDKAVALISHMPILISIALCQLVKNTKDKELFKLVQLIASSGFRDTTRVGGGNPELNKDLMTLNLLQITPFVVNYEKEISKIIKLARGNPKALLKTFIEVSCWRSKLYDLSGKNNYL